MTVGDRKPRVRWLRRLPGLLPRVLADSARILTLAARSRSNGRLVQRPALEPVWIVTATPATVVVDEDRMHLLGRRAS